MRVIRSIAKFGSPAYLVFFSLILFACLWYLGNADERPWDFAEKAGERESAGKPIPIRWHMVIGLWWGALANAIIATLLLLAAPLLSRPAPEGGAGIGEPSRPARSLGIAVTVSIVLATLWSAVFNAPRLHHSLWGDEAFMAQKSTVGEFRWASGEPSPEYHPRPWRDTLFNYKSPNNHVPYSVIARLVHGPAQENPSKPSGAFFQEWKLRLPAYLAGLLAIASTAWLLVVMGFPRAAVLVPWLLALHPWFVRYAVEARGYAFVLALVPLVLGLLLQALRRGRWRDWGAFALAEFLLFYSYPATLYFLVAANVAGLLAITFAPGRFPGMKKTLVARWFVASSVAGMGAIQLMAPLLPQLRAYLSFDRFKGAMGTPWLADAGSLLATGIPWSPWDPENPLCIAWGHPEGGAFTGGILLSVVALLVLAGVILLVKASLQTRLLTLPLVLPPVLTYLHNAVSGSYLYHWYMIPALPGVVVLTCLGLTALTRFAHPQRRRDALLLVATLIFFGLFSAATHDQRRVLRNHSSEPNRESVATYRSITNPFHPGVDEVLSAGFHMEARGYDPRARRIRSAAELEELIDLAESTGRPLYVNFAQYGLAKIAHPEILALLEDPQRFEETTKIYGLSEQCTRHVFRYRGTGS